ncbi:endonuclease/exonuclease/phosphatase family protein [Methylococcus sp. EFPC2]|uniref:endonuclease/exonuclease/phosphatase family protein n=1 Tax=Methylococcus sp. EFPC2 TaxID=2812648 RepID=UPI001967A4D6|nr:endonuclease/exonuclease/phosphatase family protein [Methylococcus sp. EFPC2]QSA96662.1 endonuclease/exonuclease/phosphatase family protein [Methylococcus sp. EFPC2]
MNSEDPSVSTAREIRADIPFPESRPRRSTLRIASFNIQTGITTASFRDYLTGSWRHLLPTSHRQPNLDRIARLLRPFDLVGLQEVDGGGTRSRRIVQTRYLAEAAGFDYWHNQVNRRFGSIALHSNGLLARIPPTSVYDYKLPGLPGRGAFLARFGENERNALYLCVLHLALSRNGRLKQLAFVGELIRGLPHVVLMGDLNCEPHSPEMKLLLQRTDFCDPVCELKTYPSWRPHKMLDHILVTPALKVEHLRALDFACSDHLPIAMDVCLPPPLTSLLESDLPA